VWSHFSCGAKAKHDMMVKVGIGVGTYAKIASKRRDSDFECLRQKRGSRGPFLESLRNFSGP